MNVKGTAILVPGQYRGAYEIGIHRKSHKALVQLGGPVKVYRDSNRDTTLDMFNKDIEEGNFFINIHRASKSRDALQVHGYSAGCQVIRRSKDHELLMSLCEKQVEVHGWEKFTYTLLDQWW